MIHPRARTNIRVKKFVVWINDGSLGGMRPLWVGNQLSRGMIVVRYARMRYTCVRILPYTGSLEWKS